MFMREGSEYREMILYFFRFIMILITVENIRTKVDNWKYYFSNSDKITILDHLLVRREAGGDFRSK